MDGGLTPAEAKAESHEGAAHQKRNWVRLTFDCNDHCIFCLDSHTHNGTNRDRNEVKEQIIDGRRKGAQRLILSGGEPTIHPNYVDFIKLGRMAGYEKVQTVTNGRLFAYKDFLTRCIDAGLGEITFSIHGPNARIHDALVGSKGAFDEEIQGLQHALDDGRVIINIDVCVNRGNVKVLPDLLEKFINLGVKEYDLLHVIPFGRAYTEGKETLFYDLEEMRPYLLKAFEYSKRPDVHIWLNRFPPKHLEGFEALIQDPYKLNDEVRGRKEEYNFLLEDGVPLDCRAPHRCGYCYLQHLCDTLDEVRDQVAEADFGIIRYDTTWEASMPQVYGGDPASAERAKAIRAAQAKMSEDGGQAEAEAEAAAMPARMRLPLLGQNFKKPVYVPLTELSNKAKASALWIIAPNVDAIADGVATFDGAETLEGLELQLDDYSGLEAALDAGSIAGKTLRRVIVSSPEDAQAMLDIEGDFEVCVELSKGTEQWLLDLESVSSRLSLRQPTHERLTQSAQQDIDLGSFFSTFTHEVPVENVPSCVLGRPERRRDPVLDTSMMTPDGRLEIFHYAKRYILDRYYTQSLRCKTCVYADSCRGMHVNYIRAHGFALMNPVESA